MKLNCQFAAGGALLVWLADCLEAVRSRWERPPYGAFATEPLRIQPDLLRGLDSQQAHLPPALRLRNGRVYVGSRQVRTHAALWVELQATAPVQLEEVVDLGFWRHGAYCPSKSPRG